MSAAEFSDGLAALLDELPEALRPSATRFLSGCAPQLVDAKERRKLLRAIDSCCALLEDAEDAAEVLADAVAEHEPSAQGAGPPQLHQPSPILSTTPPAAQPAAIQQPAQAPIVPSATSRDDGPVPEHLPTKHHLLFLVHGIGQ